MKIVNICSEANPFVKTGGLADVTYSLSKELAKDNDVSIILPLYNKIKSLQLSYKKVVDINVFMSWRHEFSNVYFLRKDGINYYFIENRHYFERDGLYGYDDDGERFAFFALASLETLKALNYKPDIIHVHDWQTGMIPVLVKETYKDFFNDTKTVINIHNNAFLGMLDPTSLGELYNLPMYVFDNYGVKLFDRVSTLKAGITYADKVVAVSPTNRNEMLSREGSNGLDGPLWYREHDFVGILNGIDYDEFNPETDKYITAHYSVDNVLAGKKKNKRELCLKMNLKNTDAPMFALVSRMTWQKGTNLVFAAVHEMVKRGANIVLLGSGEFEAECEMNRLHSLYPEQVAVYIGYNNELAHQIYAASDFFMMPSLFEPCGLGQMIAERYGTLPIVRRTGGLRDSVINFDGTNEKTSNGFGFDNFSEFDMVQTCHYALDIMNNKKIFEKLIKNAMNTDNSWAKSGKHYYNLYKSIINTK